MLSLPQLEKSIVKQKQLKRQVDEADEESTKSNVLKRKLQRENEELVEQMEVLTRELNALKSKGRPYAFPWASIFLPFSSICSYS